MECVRRMEEMKGEVYKRNRILLDVVKEERNHNAAKKRKEKERSQDLRN